MVKAEKLEYETIYNALKNGDFYSSTKPLIHELFIEDGVINIKTSKVNSVFITTENRYIKKEVGVDLEEARLDIIEVDKHNINDIYDINIDTKRLCLIEKIILILIHILELLSLIMKVIKHIQEHIY